MAYSDASTAQHRFAAFVGDRLVGTLFLAPTPVSVARSFAAELIGQSIPDARDRLNVLAGRPGPTERHRGAIVCVCFEVGMNEIVEAITQGGCGSVAAVGESLKAGTNCGSCRAEIGRLIHDRKIAKTV